MRDWFTPILITLFVLAPQAAKAGAWTQPDGHHLLVLGGLWYETDEYYNRSGQAQSQPTYTKWEIAPYYEYGLNDAITIGGSTRLTMAEQQFNANDSANFGIGDTELFSRFRLFRNEYSVISLQPLVKLPIDVDEHDRPDIGNDFTDVEMKLMGGVSWPLFGQSHYLEAGVAYRKRLGDPSDQIRAEASLGIRPFGGLLLLGQISHIHDIGGKHDPVLGLISPENDYDLTKFEASAVIGMSAQTSLQAGWFTHIDAENTGGGEGAILSLWYYF